MASLVTLEGLHALKHAARFGAHIDQILSDDVDKALAVADTVAPEVRRLIEERVKVVSRTEFREHTTQPVPTHIVAYAERPAWALAQALPSPEHPTILLDDPRNSKNLGAVIRVAAAVDAAGVLVNGQNDPFDTMAVRGAAGLQWAVPCYASTDLLAELDYGRSPDHRDASDPQLLADLGEWRSPDQRDASVARPTSPPTIDKPTAMPASSATVAPHKANTPVPTLNPCVLAGMSPHSVAAPMASQARRASSAMSPHSVDGPVVATFRAVPPAMSPHSVDRLEAATVIGASKPIPLDGVDAPVSAAGLRGSEASPSDSATPATSGASRPFTLVGLDADGERFNPAHFTTPTIFAFGSERTGLSDAMRERCDQIVSLPMRPHVSSLNLATCVSAVMYLRMYAVGFDPVTTQ